MPRSAFLHRLGGCVTQAGTTVLSTGFAKLFAASMRGVDRSRLARASMVPSGMPIRRASSRSGMPVARAVLACSHVSRDIWRRMFD
jgi:hypothetical protein